MSAPEIPRDVLDKAVHAAPLGDEAAAIIEAAWPYLYAAALRHVAERIIDDEHRYGVAESGWLYDDIRIWADEATP